MVLTDRTILVTGGTSGIDRGLAGALHRQGDRVIIAGRRQNLLDEVAAANPGMRGLRVDMRDADSIARTARDLAAIAPELPISSSTMPVSRGRKPGTGAGVARRGRGLRGQAGYPERDAGRGRHPPGHRGPGRPRPR